MKNSQTRAIPSKIIKKINEAYPDTDMGDWCRRNHRRSYQEIANANNSRQLLINQTYRRVGQV